MAVTLLKPILEQIQTTFRADLNTEVDTIDADLARVASNSIQIEDHDFKPVIYPYVKIFPAREADINSEEFNVNVISNWPVVTSIYIQGQNNSSLILALDTYLAAMIWAIIKAGDDWTLNGKCDVIRLLGIAHENYAGDTENQIIKSGFLFWQFEKEYTVS